MRLACGHTPFDFVEALRLVREELAGRFPGLGHAQCQRAAPAAIGIEIPCARVVSRENSIVICRPRIRLLGWELSLPGEYINDFRVHDTRSIRNMSDADST